ncbi:2'-5' RNA ligase family protein [Roseococcus sp. DSY-14]|uniref:2'-5' RNA ligase family protein n=1 Tax=Roseococcus sp. DSY-14 TaxID=3369650 RepID=UPI00387A8C68
MDPLIVSAEFAEPVQSALEALRRDHFPAHRNFIPAHCTLFHALPGEMEAEVLARLALPEDRRARIGPPRFTGRGVALAVEAPGLGALRAALAREWQPVLTPQDRQGWRPHVTVQNKVAPEVARALHAALLAGWAPLHTRVAALRLWRYRGGPWEAVIPAAA